MTPDELYAQIRAKRSCLCVGLDTDPAKMPEGLDVLTFNKAIIDATAPYCVAYKPNLALRNRYPEQFLIADAKRGDIGNTAKKYAETFFGSFDFDAVTLSPYMGRETVEPFLQYPGRYAIVVALSSNRSAADFQYADNGDKPLYQSVMQQCMEISSPDNMMFVVGATKADRLREIRAFCPENFLLVPGVGAQGGSAEEVIAAGANSRCGLLINSSRGILYASSGPDFAEKAAAAAAATARL